MISLFQKIVVLSVITASFPCMLFAQSKPCKELHHGIFYFYPKNSNDRYIDARDENYLHETNTVTGDTSLWKIEWASDCVYTSTYVAGNQKLDAATVKFIRKHKLVYQLSGATEDYYTFTGHVDKTANPPIQTDTMWLHEKVTPVNNELFKQISESDVNPKIQDTAQYALLYVYRTGKFALSLVDFLVYFDDNLMCVSRNNSGYVFKILKEGTFNLKGSVNKKGSVLPLDIKFGQVYYVKTTAVWGTYSSSTFANVSAKLVDPAEGRSDFEHVKYK